MKRDYKTGGLRARGKNLWELRVQVTDKSGRRVRRYFSFTGSRQAAKLKLRDLTVSAEAGRLPDDKKLFGTLIDTWDSALNVSPKTAERYRELVRLYARPHLGGLKARSITASRVEKFYSDLSAGRRADDSVGSPLAPRTIKHVHRLLVQIMALGMRDKVIDTNEARLAKRPKVEDSEIEILTEPQVREVLATLRGRLMGLIATTALATGMRRGEILALRWMDVNLETAEAHVRRSLEQTRGDNPLRFKPPKTKRGKRMITLPASLVSELRAHKAKQAKQRLVLGFGKAPEDALIFQQPDGSPLVPNSVTTEWRRLVRTWKLPKVSFHALRHTHASQLIDSGMDILTISRRLGHASPSITLNVYGHLFKPTDKAASDVFEKAFGGSFK